MLTQLLRKLRLLAERLSRSSDFCVSFSPVPVPAAAEVAEAEADKRPSPV
jgi:hypothetical protein